MDEYLWTHAEKLGVIDSLTPHQLDAFSHQLLTQAAVSDASSALFLSIRRSVDIKKALMLLLVRQLSAQHTSHHTIFVSSLFLPLPFLRYDVDWLLCGFVLVSTIIFCHL